MLKRRKKKKNNNPIFQYTVHEDRHVEGWNIICYNGEDRIGLSSREYLFIAFDFLRNGMIPQAESALNRAIALGSVRAMVHLGEVYAMKGDPERAYQCYLEAALANEDLLALHHLAIMYKNGVHVRQDDDRAEQLADLFFQHGENGLDDDVLYQKAIEFRTTGYLDHEWLEEKI